MSKNILRNLFLILFFINYSLNLSAQCTIPPTLVVAGKSMNEVQYSDGPISFIRASDFDAGSYSNCGNLVAFSFSTNVNDTLQEFDCFRIGTNSVTIFLTDTEGNQSSALTYVVVQDNFDLCSNPSSTTCPNEFILHNGLTTALSNNGTAVIHNTYFTQRIGENCAGEPVAKFDDTDTEIKTLTLSELGFNLITLRLEVNGTEANKVSTFIGVQNALSTTACIPVPIILDGINAVLNPSGTVTIFANAFDIASYSDCGGLIKLSYSANANDTVRVLNAGNIGTQSIEIWITDLQTGTQNKVAAYILLQDLLPPICAALPTVFDTCSNYQEGTLGASTDMDGDVQFDDSEYTSLSGALLSVYNNSFGTPSCVDNTAISIEQQYQLIETTCTVNIRRRYRALDFSGNASAWTVQDIQYFNYPDWQITFPANYQGGCTDVLPTAAVDIQEGNCHTFSTITTDTAGADVFYRTKRTFYITNECHNFAGKDTLIIPNIAAGIQIHSEGNENVGCIAYVQYLDIIDENAPLLTVTAPDPCISGIDFDALPLGEEDITPGAFPYECDQIKTWTAQGEDNCDAMLDFSGKIMIQGNTVLEFEGASVSYIVAPNTTYTVQFTGTDDYGNVGFSTQQHTFFDCVRPMVRLRGNQIYTLPVSGSISISVFEFDHSSFDNCSDQSKLDFRIWHSSLGITAPDNLGGIQNLPTALTLNSGDIGTNIVRVYVLDESGNWSYAETSVILNDANNCNATPFDLPVTINNFSNVGVGINTWSAVGNYAVNPVSWTGKLYEDDVLVAQVDTNAVTYTTLVAKDYKVEFMATDACGNMGMDTLTQNFSDCDEAPFVRLDNNLIFNLNTNGSVLVSAYHLDNGSFDNCTSADKFALKIWRGSPIDFPQTITDVNQLSSLMTFDCNSIGVQTIHIFVINDMGNYASAPSFVLIQDNNGVCSAPPPNLCSEIPLNLTGNLSIDSTYRAMNTITSTTTIITNTNITFQAGQNITLNNGFHAIAGSVFIAKIEACSNANTLTTLPTTEQEQVKIVKTEVMPEKASLPFEKMEMVLNVYPNPFHNQTTVDYFIPEAGGTIIQLRDFLGRKVNILANNEQKKEGWYQLQLDASKFPSGAYYLVLMHNGQLKTRKLIILK